MDRDTHGLTALPTAERGGFVFTILTPGTPMDIDAWLGDYADELDKLGLADWHVFSRRELEGASWKVCYDGYLEGYHFAVAAPGHHLQAEHEQRDGHRRVRPPSAHRVRQARDRGAA